MGKCYNKNEFMGNRIIDGGRPQWQRTRSNQQTISNLKCKKGETIDPYRLIAGYWIEGSRIRDESIYWM